jgi:hypothetical protein
MAKAAIVNSKKLERKFAETAFRISQERNDFLLPHVIDLVRQNRWVNLRPEYQRRLVWDDPRRSRFIESLLLNVPIPPVFLYEKDLSRYEVMDGQQRLNSVVDFYENKFALRDLEIWSDLNGLLYEQLPETLKRGLDRRRISATVLLAERAREDEPSKIDIRKLVFERLNTGGIHLRPQELRNCIYPGSFNDLMIDLSADRKFTDIWEIPPHKNRVYVHGKTASELRKNQLYTRMEDCELVLRFFALRDRENIKGSVRSMLDRCMANKVNASATEIQTLRDDFMNRLNLAAEIFGGSVFRYRDAKGKLELSRTLFDGVMVALDRLWGDRDRILASQQGIVEAVESLLSKESAYEVIIGKPNTAKAVKKRIDLLAKTIAAASGK